MSVKTTFCEADLEQEAHRWLASLGWQVRHGLELAPGGLFAERRDYQQVVLEERLRNAIAALNPDLPEEAIEEAYRKVLNPEGATLEQRNRAFHRMLIEGVPVDYRTGSGERRGGQARIVDFDAPDNNDWLAVRTSSL
jgi:type I restriction enzyme R subunit